MQRESWERHSHEWTPLHVDRMRARRGQLKEWVAAYLAEHPCVDCGESDADVLEFDHREGEDEDAEIGELVNHGAALYRLEREIGTCDVRCANHHRKRHALERRRVR